MLEPSLYRRRHTVLDILCRVSLYSYFIDHVIQTDVTLTCQLVCRRLYKIKRDMKINKMQDVLHHLQGKLLTHRLVGSY